MRAAAVLPVITRSRILLLALLLAHPAALSQVSPRVTYRLRHVPPTATAGAVWEVEVLVRGAAGLKDLRMRLPEWSDWRDDPSYLEVLEVDPAVRDAGLFVPRVGGSRDEARLRYRLHLTRRGSARQRRHGLLPTLAGTYAFGWSWNTLVQVLAEGRPVAGARTLEIEAPADMPVVTGWAGASVGRQTAVLDAAMGNGPIAFGAPARTLSIERSGFGVEVYQFGAGPDVSASVAEVIARCAPALGRALGVPARNPYRVFVTDDHGGGMGSHHGLRIGVTAQEPADIGSSPWLRHLVVHELFHDWLGLTLEQRDASVVWFKEGFTEYLSLWQVAAAGLVTRETFARRLLELESIARERSSAARVAFADPGVRWRDGDGPNETLAYTGAPLLALRMDAELRAAGGAGLLQMVRDLLAREERVVGLQEIRAWMEAHGLKGRYERSLAGRELPDVAASLALAGYREVEEKVDLAYLGLRTESETPGTRVLAVDPCGPAARAGLSAGDVLTGWSPVRPRAVRVRGFETPYPFALGAWDPAREGAYVNYRRDGQDHHAPVVPRVIAGKGVLARRICDGPALDAFFTYRPR